MELGISCYSHFCVYLLHNEIHTFGIFQIPATPSVSALCADLLQGLLERDPQRRISFDRFFGHSFIDLEHMPSPHSLPKAVSNLAFANYISVCRVICMTPVLYYTGFML